MLGAGGWMQSFTARQLKLDDADVSFEYQGSTPIWSGSVTMTARSDTFVDKLLDEGYWMMVSAHSLQRRGNFLTLAMVAE